MKSDNDDVVFTCSMFTQNLDAYIDDELDEDIKIRFLSHAAKCEQCNLQLVESKRLKKALANLTQVSVTPGFNDRLRMQIRLESSNLNYPLYRFKLFMRENMREVLIVPALAVLIIGILFSRADLMLRQNNQPQITQNKITSVSNDISLESEDYPEEINYVLESIKPGEIETGVFPNEYDMSIPVTSNTSNLTLTCF